MLFENYTNDPNSSFGLALQNPTLDILAAHMLAMIKRFYIYFQTKSFFSKTNLLRDRPNKVARKN